VALKYKEILNSMLDYENIFNSQKVDEKVESVKKNSKILIKIIDLWLEKHTISETELELLRETIKQL
jgi:3-methyladenine DNA glycosylase AlkC